MLSIRSPETSIGCEDRILNRKRYLTSALQAYTSGRWLRNNSEQCKARHVNLNLEEVATRVVSLCPGSKSITEIQKHEGGYSKVLVCTSDTGQRLVVKFPTFVAGPGRLTTSSETQIPIPNILNWSSDPANIIGSEFIIMEHATGVSLDQIWSQMSESQQMKCIKSIVEQIGQMTELAFPSYGSIYCADERSLDQSSDVAIDPRFCVSPNCSPRYWNCNVESPRYYDEKGPNGGPWRDLTSYCNGLLDAAKSRIPPSDVDMNRLPPYQGTPTEHLQLLRQARNVINKLLEHSTVIENSLPTLFHPDLHKRNIFVAEDDPTRVTAIIDWQSTTIEPAFYYADERPDFATTIPEEAEKDTEAATEEDCTAYIANLCSQTFELSVQFLAPRLASARAMNEDLIRVLRYCHRTWKDGAVVLRQELQELSERWEELGLLQLCPYPLTSGEKLKKQRREFEMFQSVLNSKKAMVEALGTTSDGWAPNETWEEVQAMHRTLYTMALEEVQRAQDPTFSVKDLRMTWPFDLP
ncbi:MAG: hypothetical protein Q9160_003316 [Pyrenula sp. 1 TL-2023]